MKIASTKKRIQRFGNYCEAAFPGEDGDVVNAFKCPGKRVTVAGMWQVHQNKKPVTTGSAGLMFV